MSPDDEREQQYTLILNNDGEIIKNKVKCICGKEISTRRLKAHQETNYHKDNLHKQEVSKHLKEERDKQNRKTDYRQCYYRCDRGIHKGKYLEDVVKFHPQYIQFLITHHRSTFPLEFCQALRDCGVEFE